ncbi:hypothetical protein L6452_09383 [Arctium lappa]|uniref:Uncharacterized protein n=1 Tax=Arctium lappa TaxID=4217 RepID=A0ACB9DKC4_ARCLA|nr:hypothetical protein L6452_09383 [Arctium lappa]
MKAKYLKEMGVKELCMLKNFELLSKSVMKATKYVQSQPQQSLPVDPATTPTPATLVSSALPTYDRYVYMEEFDNLNAKLDGMEDQIAEVNQSIRVLAYQCKVQAEKKRKFEYDDSHDDQKGEKRQRTESAKPSAMLSDPGDSSQNNQRSSADN